MSNQNDLVFSLYKPLRNQIRSYNLLDSLQLIWSYSRNFTFNLPFPSDIESPAGFSPNGDINLRRYRGLPEFEQEFLLREFILHCDTNPTRYSLKQKDKLGKLVNYMRKSFSEEIDTHFTITGDFLLEFNRMAHRQFKWQTVYNQSIIFRYYKVYNDTEVRAIIKNKLKLTPFELFIIGFFFFRATADHFRTNLPYLSEVPAISTEKIAMFFQLFSMPIEQARNELKECQQMNENIFYSFNPLYARPILIYQNSFICPIQMLLFWQVTTGIYYSIVGEHGFENSFGNSFQNYIGEILYICCNNPDIKILEEAKYGKEEMRTTDWIIFDKNAVLFIECKAKRMTMVSKSELDIKKGLESDLKKMASFITQIYKTYVEYTLNKYPHIVFDASKKFIPLIVTLEDWFINMNPSILEMLGNFVIEDLKANDIDTALIDKFPYYIRSCDDFEKDIQLINSLGVLEYFDKIEKNDINNSINNFKYKNPFEGEFEKTFIEPLRHT